MLKIKEVINKVIIKKVASMFLLSVFFIGLFYVLFSPVIIVTMQTAASKSVPENLVSFFSPFSSFQTALAATTGSTSVLVVVANELMVTAPSNFNLTGTIGGLTGGTATGTADFSVLNNSGQNGFNMTIKASSTPALATGSYGFADYSPNAVTGTPDYDWVAPIAGTSSFAFAVAGDVAASANIKFRNDGSSPCNIGSQNSSTYCWSGFLGTTAIPVISTTGFSSTAIIETIALKASFTNDNVHTIAADTYQATITATIAAN